MGLSRPSHDRLDRLSSQIKMAVAVGFEPTEACTSHAFEVWDLTIAVRR